MKSPLLFLALLSLPLSAQGPLAPPGAPAPTQKSLQEIWDKLTSVETTVVLQQQQIALLQQQNALLMEPAGVNRPWRFSDVKGPISGNAGPSLAFTPSGAPAIAYRYSNMGEIHYAVREGNEWQISVVDGPELPLSTPSLAFDSAGNPMIAYRSDGFSGAPSTRGLKLARWDGSSWVRTMVEDGETGHNCHLKLSPAGEPAIAYDSEEGEDTTDALRYAYLSGGVWQFETVSTLPGLHRIPSLAFRQDGTACIAFRNFDKTRIHLAIRDGGTWTTETIVERNFSDPENTDEFSSPCLAFSPSGQPAVAYDSYESSGYLNFAVRHAPGDWERGRVISAGDWGFTSTLAFNPAGQPAIAFLTDPDVDETGSSLAYAVLKGGSWDIEYAGSLNFPKGGASVHLAFTPGAQPAMGFYDPDTSTLGYAVRSIFASP